MVSTAAIAACAILVLLAVFQLALIFGAPIGRFAWGGQTNVLPTRLRIGSAVSIGIYALIAVVLLERAGWLHWVGNAGLVRIAAWVVFAYFALGILMNAISRSKLERFTMAPVALILAVLSLLVALG